MRKMRLEPCRATTLVTQTEHKCDASTLFYERRTAVCTMLRSEAIARFRVQGVPTRQFRARVSQPRCCDSMAYGHGYAPDMVAEGQAILDNKSTSIGELKDDFLTFLAAHNIVQKSVVHTDLLLTHPTNRGSLLLNANNAHRNGSLIRRVGANISELHNAVCIEVSPDPIKRQET